MRAVLVPVDGPPEIIDVEPGDIGPRVLGGWLEIVLLKGWPGEMVHAYIDEEGKLKGLPVNQLATDLAHVPGDVIAGPMVILGSDGPEEADVPEEVLAALGLV